MIPADKILENQYTRGSEYVDNNGKYYQGYYCVVLNTKYYTGKTYTPQSVELSKVGATQPISIPTSLPPQTTPTRYFLKKVNHYPIIIKEVDEMTYNMYKNDSFYQSTTVESKMIFRNSPELDKAESQMSGLKIFLSV
jgi:hypothetical protein